MRKCFTINCKRNENDFKGFNKILSQGLYQGIEIFYPYNVSIEQKDFYDTEVQKLIDLYHPEVVLHLPFGHNNDLLGENKEEVFQRMVDAITYANKFNVKKLTLHLGIFPKDKTREEAVNEVCDVVKKLCNFASKFSINLMIENMPAERELGFSPEEILYIIKRCNKNNLFFILDTGHANVSKINIEEYIYLLKDYLIHIHFSDNDGLRDLHNRVNSGTIDFVKVFKALNEIKYNNLHCMEVLYNNSEDLVLYASDIDIYNKYYKFKKYIYLDYGYSSSSEEKFALIKETGFDGVFLFANDEFLENVNLAKKYQLDIETIHLPFQNVCNNLWIENEKSTEYVEDIKKWINIASENGIDKVIFHLSQSTNPPKPTEKGFERLKEIVEVCEKRGVYLALENLRYLDYLNLSLEKIKSDKLICCFDSGHANCFTKNINEYDFMKYKGLIRCLHLHDNNGLKDEHLIPFMGNIDFIKLSKELKKIGYNGPLTLEVMKTNSNSIKYENLSEIDFLKMAFASLCKIEEYFCE